MKQETTPLYIRFGEIPTDGKSKVYRGDAIIREEAGVSVWRAVEANGRYYPVLPDEPNKNTIADYFEFVMNCKCNVYLVTGTEICIEGADREPLLEDVKILEDITWYYKRDTNIDDEEPDELDSDSDQIENNQNHQELQSKGVSVVIGNEKWISDDSIVLRLLMFYALVKHTTKNCSWTPNYPDEEIIRMDLFYCDRIPYIFFKDDKIVGTIMVDMRDPTEVTLNRVAVHPNMQGTGFSKLMIKTVLSDMKYQSFMNYKIKLYVWENNIAAQKLYESVGFKRTNQTKEMRGMNFYIYEMRLS